ncbi:MAG: type IV pilus assembly protein PilM [Lentisphaerae bacterium]|nr:type IV pilus assembly protein PilM [Lentisphaerota bacterium]
MNFFKSNRVLAMDIGAAQLKLAEFVAGKAGLELANLAVCPLGIAPGDETDPTLAIVDAIQAVLKEKAIKPAPVMLSVTGQSAFLRLVKLPPVKRHKLHQTILYEAQQNVPFPMQEVVWDYQLMGASENELNVTLVVIKKDIVQNLADCVEAVGLDIELIDVAPMALYNAVRYNYAELKGCTLVVDIGARSTNLIFMEEGQFFSRNLPIVGTGNVITQQLMKEFNLSFQDAEALKFAHASVAFGGSYEDYSDQVLSKASKTVRGVMTRLHIEVERSINFYRTQQGGANPERMLLAGGTSVIARTDEFFREKLKMDVEYLNPFRNIIVTEGISEETVGTCAHVMGAVVGVGLRYALPCPLEVNLLPPRLMAEKSFRRKQPFLVAAGVTGVLVALCWWFFFHTMTQRIALRHGAVRSQVVQLEAVEAQLRPIEERQAAVKAGAEVLADMVFLRGRWLEVLNAVQDNLLDGMWLVSFVPVSRTVADNPLSASAAGPTPPGHKALAALRQGASIPQYTHIQVKGLIFADKATDRSIAQFRDRLRQSPFFTEATEILLAPLPNMDDYARQFTLEIALKHPL